MTLSLYLESIQYTTNRTQIQLTAKFRITYCKALFDRQSFDKYWLAVCVGTGEFLTTIWNCAERRRNFTTLIGGIFILLLEYNLLMIDIIVNHMIVTVAET